MTNQRWITIPAGLVTAGGLAWLAKMAVIAATDGTVDNEGAAAVFFVTGAVLMAAGASAPLMRFVRPARRWTSVLALLAGPLAFALSFMVLEGIAKGLAGDAGPTWLADEVGILATGAFWVTAGLALLRRPGIRVEAGLVTG